MGIEAIKQSSVYTKLLSVALSTESNRDSSDLTQIFPIRLSIYQ